MNEVFLVSHDKSTYRDAIWELDDVELVVRVQGFQNSFHGTLNLTDFLPRHGPTDVEHK